MDEIAELRAQNARLRGLLEEYGIDPDPAPEADEPPVLGPPTLLEHIIREAFRRAAGHAAASLTARNVFNEWLKGAQWMPAQVQALRIRLPADFSVRS